MSGVPLTLVPLLLASIASAAAPPPIVDTCAEPARALVLVAEGLDDAQRSAVEAEVRVEGARLGLQVCRQPLPGALVSARVAAGPASLHLEASHAGRLVGQELPLPAPTEQAALETALILGDLVREVLEPPGQDPLSRAAWSLGARGAFEGFPSSSGWLFGGDAVVRHLWSRVGFELFAGARASRRFDSAYGSIGLLGVGGGAALLVSLVHPGPFELLLSAGARAQAVNLQATASGDAQAQPGWAPVIDARAGLLFELAVGPVTLSLGAGADEPLLGAVATAGGRAVTGLSNLGLYTSLGLTFTPGAPR